MSKRGEDWVAFSHKVLDHIEEYTVPQYGDKGEDQCTTFEPVEFLAQLKRYVNRSGRNSREGQDLLDLIKMAHYSQMLHDCLESADRLSDIDSNSNS